MPDISSPMPVVLTPTRSVDSVALRRIDFILLRNTQVNCLSEPAGHAMVGALIIVVFHVVTFSCSITLRIMDSCNDCIPSSSFCPGIVYVLYAGAGIVFFAGRHKTNKCAGK